MTWVNEHPKGSSGFKHDLIQRTWVFSISPRQIPLFCFISKSESPRDSKWLPGACRSPMHPCPRAAGTKNVFPPTDRWGRWFFSCRWISQLIGLKCIRCVKPIRTASWETRTLLSQSEPISGGKGVEELEDARPQTVVSLQSREWMPVAFFLFPFPQNRSSSPRTL